jgi:hypothetical protein
VTAANTEADFWARVDRSGGPDACWPWTASCQRVGLAYGLFNWRDKTRRAHRLAYAFVHGPIPDGLCVLHRCDNPPCCNPAHLFLGTHADNNRDMIAKGRAKFWPGAHGGTNPPPAPRFGEANSTSKLTEAAVREIRAANDAGESARGIARRLGVAATTVRDVLSGKNWRHVA